MIQDRRIRGQAAINLKPTDSTTAVTCASFGPTKGGSYSQHSYIALGFQDGTLAIYKVATPIIVRVQDCPHEVTASDTKLYSARVAAIRKLHRASMGGVTAAAFIPGYKLRVITVGHDGRCRLVDFEGGGQKLRT